MASEDKPKQWHIWIGQDSKMNCVLSGLSHFAVIGIDPTAPEKVQVQFSHDIPRQNLLMMYQALEKFLVGENILPPIPKPIPVAMPERVSATVTTKG